MKFVRLNRLCIVTVTGADAAKIANNLCTANVIRLETGEGCEAFVTEVRGKMLGHVCLYRTESGLLLVGAARDGEPTDTSAIAVEATPGQAEAIVSHFDRYTLREKSIPENKSGEYVGFVVDQELAGKLHSEFPLLLKTLRDGNLAHRALSISPDTSTTKPADFCIVPWWSEGAGLLLVKQEDSSSWHEVLCNLGGVEAGVEEFHQRRIQAAFPWYGMDLDATHLPQEADRDQLAISFTKGCYLGQETVARLDALGQVQKKLVRWNLSCSEEPPLGTELRDGDRVVGKLTSICAGDSPQKFLAIGFARRSHFNPGLTATGMTPGGQLIQAVVASPTT